MDETLDELSRLCPHDRAKAKKGLARILRDVSQNPSVGCRLGERIGALDMTLFDRKKIPCAPAVFISSFLLFDSFLVLLALYFINLPSMFQFVCLASSFFCLWFFSHDLAHFVVGSALGVRFPFFFSGRSAQAFALRKVPLVGMMAGRIPALGLKIDYATFFCISRKRRAVMFTSGALASMLLPLFVVAVAWQIETEAWIRFAFLFAFIGNMLFTIPASYLYGDFAKARRQR